MQKQKWVIIGIGLFFVLCFFLADKNQIDENSIVTKTILVKTDIRKVIGSRSKRDYYINAYNYACDFCILVPGGMAAKSRSHLDSIKVFDTLTVGIFEEQIADLQTNAKDVSIYSLEINGRSEFTLSDYNAAKQKYARRWSIVSLIAGSIVTIHGLGIISRKTAFIIGGLCFALLIALRFFNIAW